MAAGMLPERAVIPSQRAEALPERRDHASSLGLSEAAGRPSLRDFELLRLECPQATIELMLHLFQFPLDLLDFG